MTRLDDVFDFPITRATVGFDRMFKDMERTFQNSKSVTYPPYNISKDGEDSYLIEIAVAGFKEEDFDIQLHRGVLSVTANILDEDDKEYLHKGIAARSFERRFTLADTIEVENVSLDQGMLSIHLINRVPEELQPKKIEITSNRMIEGK